ncbi:MAG TPA: DUF2269 family protein [Actinomycetota bacterium]|nr:DUF2269 family protein [Actinomycetota bacterium]
MITVYDAVKFLHVVLAIIAVGFNASYGIWLSRAARDPDHELHVLRGIKALDDRFANPAYALLLVTGLIMVAISGVRITDFWIAAGLALYALVVVVGAGLYTPTLRRQIEVLEVQGPTSPAYQRLATRSRITGIGLAIPTIIIVFLMVTKPTL